MSSSRLFNNIGIDALAIVFVLEKSDTLPISKALLVAPIVSHQALMNHLARKSTKVLSFEKYLIENIGNFSNFNDRFYGTLTNSVNAIQLLSELAIIEFRDGSIRLIREIEFNKKMGKRAEKIRKAAPNIAKLISEKKETTYLNLRIEL